jgi:hypothetical protein
MLRARWLILGLLVLGVGGISIAAASTVMASGARRPAIVQQAQPARIGVVEIRAGADVSGMVSSASNQNASRSVANALARQYGVPAATILRLRNTGWSYADVARIYDFSKQSGKSPALIRSMRAAGIDWNNIAEALNIRPQSIETVTANLRGNLDLNDVLTGTVELTGTLP